LNRSPLAGFVPLGDNFTAIPALKRNDITGHQFQVSVTPQIPEIAASCIFERVNEPEGVADLEDVIIAPWIAPAIDLVNHQVWLFVSHDALLV
jgi:hypothetical protein